MNENDLEWLNALDEADAVGGLRRCCGSTRWCEAMASARPFASAASLAAAAEAAFDRLDDNAWLEAIRSHPKIGDFESLKMRFAGNKEWSGGEQAGAAGADEETLHRLAAGNAAYEERFGYLFVVCATGKSAAEMLALLERRLDNGEAAEFRIACGEQRKITHLRIAKLQPPTANADEEAP